MLALTPVLTPESRCDDCPAAEFIDEVCVSLHDRIIRKPFGLVKAQSSALVSDDFPQTVPDDGGMPARPKKPDAVAAGDRLRRTREALGIQKRRRLAQLMDVPEDNLEKWENGGAMVPPSFIRKLRDAYQITYEWIYDGIVERLPHELVLKLTKPPDD